MELKYIWVKEYKNIKNTGFNFQHSSNVEYTFTGNELLLSEKMPVLKDFFGSNILGVTAIVGKNGSGKTNLTEFINYNLAHATNGGLSTYYASVGLLVISNYIFAQQTIEIYNEVELVAAGYKILRFENAPLDIGQGELRWHEMETNKYIYYSPAFDNRGIPVEDNLVNISSTMLAYNDRFNSPKLYPLAVGENSTVNQLTAHQEMENDRISKFLLYFENANEYIDFTPASLKLAIDTQYNNYLLRDSFKLDDGSDSSQEWRNMLSQQLDNICTYLVSASTYSPFITGQREKSATKYYSITIEEQRAIVKRLLFLQIFRALLNNKISFPDGYFRKCIFNNTIDDLEETPHISALLRELSEVTDKLLKVANLSDMAIPMAIDGAINSKALETTIFDRLGSIEIPLAKNKILLREFCTLLSRVTLDDIISLIPIGNLSSGQTHWLTFFSRFYWAKRKIEDSEIAQYGINGETIVIFIDEGEVALHPEWQRRYFSQAIKFLGELFPKKTIQLLLTTHSPFVLSDIPKEYVLFLERDEEGFCEVSTFDKEETFAANIYNLLSDSFFMNNTLGKFAEDKLTGVVKSLNAQEENTAERREEIRYIISRIGEPLIKEQLEHMYNVRYADDEVAILRARIKELENQNKRG